jgi:hypothetical protein
MAYRAPTKLFTKKAGPRIFIEDSGLYWTALDYEVVPGAGLEPA